MKLRIEAKSIRVRLSEEEFDLIRDRNRLSATIELEPDSHFTFIIMAGNYSAIQAQFMPFKLEIRVPFSLLKNWINSGDTGISSMDKHEQDSGKPVIIIEKDLPPKRKKMD